YGRSLLAGFAGLAQDALAGVLDALALVGLGLADAADVGGDLADDFLVDAVDHDLGRHRHLERDAFGRLHVDRMAETEVEAQRVGALGLGAVADTDDLEVLLEAVGDADDHVVDEAAREAVLGTVVALVVGAGAGEHAAVDRHLDLARDLTAERALGALDRDRAFGDQHF